MNPLQAIRDEIARLEGLKRSIDEQLSMLRQSEKALEPVYREHRFISVLDAYPHDDTNPGLTHMVRHILASSYPGAAKPVAIRDLLVQTGQVNPEGRSNFLAEIHNILKRLEAQGEAALVQLGPDKAYTYVPNNPLFGKKINR